MSWVNQFNNLSNKSRLLLIEAAFYMTLWQMVVKLFPFNWYRFYLGEQTINPSKTCLPISITSKELRKAIYSSSKYLPWKPVCFPQALAAKSMLKKRGEKCTLYFGASGKNVDKIIDLHVWLDCNEQTITGGLTKHLFTVYRVYQ